MHKNFDSDDVKETLAGFKCIWNCNIEGKIKHKLGITGED